MGSKCPYCNSRKSEEIKRIIDGDMMLIRYKCLDCNKVFAVWVIKYEDKEGKVKERRIKLKALRLPIEIYDKDGKYVTSITYEDLKKEHERFLALARMGLVAYHLFDDEYAYYGRDYEIYYDGYYAALYCDGIRYASKRLY